MSGKRRGAGSTNDAQTNGMLLKSEVEGLRAPPAHPIRILYRITAITPKVAAVWSAAI